MPSNDKGEKTVGTISMRGRDPLTRIVAANAVIGPVHHEELARMALMSPEDVQQCADDIKEDLGADVLESLNSAMAGGRIPNDKCGRIAKDPLTQLWMLLRILARKDDVRSQLEPGDLQKLTDQEAQNILFDVFVTMEDELRIDLAKHDVIVDPKFDGILPSPEKKELAKETKEADELNLMFANGLAKTDVWIRSDGSIRGRYGVSLLLSKDQKLRAMTADYVRRLADAIEKGQ
jgi:hypothetical protein